MNHKYAAPATVTSPQDCVSNVQVVYDGGPDSFSLVRLDWDGKPCVAIRWNIAEREWDDPEKASGQKVCVGMPSSRGFPVWFILPDEILKQDSKIWELIDAGKSA